MARCERFESCAFHQGRLARYSEKIHKNIIADYCEGDYLACARYIIYAKLGQASVPPDLAPFDHRTASELLSRLCPTKPVDSEA